jgi:AraC-like DNA-binding protein
MSRIEKIEDFYKRKLGWVPDNFHNQIGHFNVFELTPFVGKHAQPVPYVKRDYYKIMLSVGSSRVNYADKSIDIEKQGLVFSNPEIPYFTEGIASIREGYFCIFNQDFFRQFGNISHYPVFHPQGNHVFELVDEQGQRVAAIFRQMLAEINSSYVYKYDLLKALALELIHVGLKLEPSLHQHCKEPHSASSRITTLFLELLERQFPINESHAAMRFRNASDFAKQLNVHVNHLNRAIKETTQKTTSQVLAERILHEAKILLKQSEWNISEIAFSLGFAEASHFNNFFKKQTGMSPSAFRR